MGCGLDLMTLWCLAVAAVLLDRCLGEPRRWHPLVGFGRLAAALEGRLNRGQPVALRGLACVLLLVLSPAAGAWWLLAQWPVLWAWAGHAVLLMFALGARSLQQHLWPIAQALQAHDLPAARRLTARIVSRDTAQAGEADLAKAAVESALENGNDAVFGALFWFVLAGGPGALAFRLANTLDAMWGYRSPRYLHFGRAAARLDDALNWLPARFTALSYAVFGRTLGAWRCWQHQAPAWRSPNAGPVMAAGAGSLGLLLGGPAQYDGRWEQRPPLGQGRVPRGADIGRALQLVDRSLALWLLTLNLLGWLGWALTQP